MNGTEKQISYVKDILGKPTSERISGLFMEKFALFGYEEKEFGKLLANGIDKIASSLEPENVGQFLDAYEKMGKVGAVLKVLRIPTTETKYFHSLEDAKIVKKFFDEIGVECKLYQRPMRHDAGAIYAFLNGDPVSLWKMEFSPERGGSIVEL